MITLTKGYFNVTLCAAIALRRQATFRANIFGISVSSRFARDNVDANAAYVAHAFPVATETAICEQK